VLGFVVPASGYTPPISRRARAAGLASALKKTYWGYFRNHHHPDHWSGVLRPRRRETSPHCVQGGRAIAATQACDTAGRPPTSDNWRYDHGSLMSLNRSLSLATWLLDVTTSSLRLPGSGGCMVRLAVHQRRL
jgi:hypothetical protein